MWVLIGEIFPNSLLWQSTNFSPLADQSQTRLIYEPISTIPKILSRVLVRQVFQPIGGGLKICSQAQMIFPDYGEILLHFPIIVPPPNCEFFGFELKKNFRRYYHTEAMDRTYKIKVYGYEQ
jgi:hypothetical protein